MNLGSQPDSGRILVVDDDPISLGLLSHILERQGYQVRRAGGGPQARQMLAGAELHDVDCVLTDYQMPEFDGLELLRWISSQPEAPSVVMVTGEGQKETIAASLRHGASDYLEKPVDPGKLIRSVQRAVGNAIYRREVRGMETAAVRIAETQQSVLKAGIGSNVHLFHRSRHALGGDSIAGFDLTGGRRLYLVCDVSGHDLDSAFTTAYFQGVVRGMAECGATVPEILRLFNRLLLSEWSGNRSDASIALCGIEVSKDPPLVTVYRCGAPLAVYTDGCGRARTVAFGSTHPLGWFDSFSPAVEQLSLTPGTSVYVWTDGLVDLAEDLGISPLSLAYRLLDNRDSESLVALATDDVLVARIDVGPLLEEGTPWFAPVLAQVYSPGQVACIDSIQDSWRRSLLFVVPDIEPSYLYDILLCSREAVLNGLEHGCLAGQDARFVLSYSPTADALRAHISDPGPGHGRNMAQGAFDPHSEDRGRGLVLIGRLTDHFSVERQGAEITMEWAVRRVAAGCGEETL